MLLEKIRKDADLQQYIVEKCEENEVCVTIDERIERENYVIIKPDDFYNAMNIEKRLASPDCLIIQQCTDQNYALTIVELKNIENSRGFTTENMFQKFETCLSDFMQARFGDYFNREYKRIDLYFVSNIEIYRRDMGLKMSILMNKRFDFNGKKCLIKPMMPTPTIKPCY